MNVKFGGCCPSLAFGQKLEAPKQKQQPKQQPVAADSFVKQPKQHDSVHFSGCCG